MERRLREPCELSSRRTNIRPNYFAVVTTLLSSLDVRFTKISCRQRLGMAAFGIYEK